MSVIENLNNHNLLEIFNIVNFCFRWVFWQVVRLLALVVNGVEGAINKIYTLNGFFYSPEVINMLNKYRPVIWIILAFSIAFLGYKFIFNRKVNKVELPGNFLLAVAVVVLLPTMMLKLGSMSNIIINDSMTNNSTSANEILKSNIYDLYYLDSNNFNLSNKNNINPENILSIDALETIDLDEVKNDDILGKKIELDKNGNKKLVDLEKGFFKIDETYYRYSIDFLTIIVTLGATGIALICFGLKLGRLFYELGFNQIFATIIAFADIQDGKKLKATINQIFTTFIIIFSTSIILKLYFIYTTWVGTTLSSGDLASNFAKLLLLVGASIAVIDGPNIIERILGMDAGLKNAWSTMVGTYGAAKVAGGVGKTILNVGSTVGKGALMGGSFTAGAISGMMGKSNNGENNRMNSNVLLNEGIEDDINKKSTSTQDKSNESERDDLGNDMSIEEEMEKVNSNKHGIKNSEDENINGFSINNNENKSNKSINNLNDRTSNENSTSGSKDKDSRSIKDSNKDVLENNTNSNDRANKSNIESKDNRDKYIDMDNIPSIEEDIMNSSKGAGRKDTSTDIGEGRNTSKANKSNISNDNIINNANKNNNSDNNDFNSLGNRKSNIGKEEGIKKETKENVNINKDSKIQDARLSQNEGLNSNPNKEFNLSGKMEDRTISQYMKDKVRANKLLDDINRSFNLGKNTTSDWDIRRNKKINKHKFN